MRKITQTARLRKKMLAAPQLRRSAHTQPSTHLEIEALEARVMPTVVTIGPSKDNTLYQSATGSLSDGAGPTFFAGITGPKTNDSIRRGVIAFDIAGIVPAGATITSASLTLHMSRTVGGPQTVQLKRLLAD